MPSRAFCFLNTFIVALTTGLLRLIVLMPSRAFCFLNLNDPKLTMERVKRLNALSGILFFKPPYDIGWLICDHSGS